MTRLIAFILALLGAQLAHAAPTFGILAVSVHDRPGFNNVTPGFYVIADNGLTAGAYRNSIERNSVLAGWTWRHGAFALTFAGITGYAPHEVKPAIVPSILIGHVRIALLLDSVVKPGAPNALTFGWEF